jgi:hypothetical protein
MPLLNKNERQNQDKDTSEEDVYFNFVNSIKCEVTKAMYEDYIKEFMKFCNVSKLSELLTIEPQKQVIKYLIREENKPMCYNFKSNNKIVKVKCPAIIILAS